ncbi:MAG: DNA polymerase [Acidobacteriota bacterium]
MVAQTIQLPNIRRFFVPDAGYIIAECDLTGAEAQVVAWDAGDEDLKAAFRAGVNVHIKNARDVFPEKVRGWSDEAIKATDYTGGLYNNCKKCVHATHNGGRPAGLARQIGIPVVEAENFQKIWFGLHPAIEARHDYILACLQGRVEGNPPRTIINRFGYRITFFDRIDNVFTEALTWIQQSTVALVCAKGGINVDEQISWAQLLLQVHDSLVLQYPISRHGSRGEIRDALEVVVPYDDPLIIPWGLKTSRKSWGDAEAETW